MRRDQNLDEDWLAFLDIVIGGLRMAAKNLRERKAEYELHIDWFRRAQKGIPRENSVSKALAELLKEIRAEQIIYRDGVKANDLRHIQIYCEERRPFDPGISDGSKPTDFAIQHEGAQLDLRIEAKIIVNEPEIKTNYLGKDGLERFDDNKNPYTVASYGAMVAYVVDADAKTWEGKIGKAVKEAVGADRSNILTLSSGDHCVSKHRIEYRSDRKNIDTEIDVVHFSLEIDAKPPKR